MQIDIVDDLHALERLAPNWRAVYEADPEGHYFLSWTWMSRRLRELGDEWLVLAARASPEMPDYVGFFPLRLRTMIAKNGRLANEIAMAGNPVADYTGFICAPELEAEVAGAFGAQIRSLRWARLNLESIRCPDQRLNLLLQGFTADRFVSRSLSAVNAKDGIDNSVCLYAVLPDTFDAYLDRLSSNTRQKLRRLLRTIDSSPRLRITLTDRATLKRDLDALLHLWGARWGERKGAHTQTIQRILRLTLTNAAESDALFMPVLWSGDTPVGVIASIIDPVKKELLFFVAARDETFDGPSPGLALHAYSVRHAISQGIKVYDFLRGNEPYKYSFGVSERRIGWILVSTTDGIDVEGKLDPRSVRGALRCAGELREAGKLEEAEHAYRQVLDIESQCAPALLALAEVRLARRDPVGAEKLLRALVGVEPASHQAWFGLGVALERQERYAAAAEAYQASVGAKLDYVKAHYGAGRALQEKGDIVAAVRSFRTASAIGPGYRDVDARLAELAATIAPQATSNIGS